MFFDKANSAKKQTAHTNFFFKFSSNLDFEISFQSSFSRNEINAKNSTKQINKISKSSQKSMFFLMMMMIMTMIILIMIIAICQKKNLKNVFIFFFFFILFFIVVVLIHRDALFYFFVDLDAIFQSIQKHDLLNRFDANVLSIRKIVIVEIRDAVF
jgi:uncharacterized membrane protein